MVNPIRMTVALVATVAALVVGAGLHPSAAADRQCPPGGVKIEHAPWAYSGDRIVTGVCIKAGLTLTGFSQDGCNGCYTVTGIGTTHVVVRGGGTSRQCKDISNVVFYFEPGKDEAPGAN